MWSVTDQRATVLWHLLGYLLKDLGKGLELAFWPPAAVRPAQKSVGICDMRERIEYAPPALEGEVLTTGLPGKSLGML